MDSIVNFGIPHVGEQIFQNLNTADLLQCLEVSNAWKTLAQKVLQKRLNEKVEALWNGKIVEVFKSGKVDIVKISVDVEKHINPEEEVDELPWTENMWACKILEILYYTDHQRSKEDLDIAIYILDHHENEIMYGNV